MDLSTFQHLHLHLEHEGRVAVLRFDHGKANEMGRDHVAEIDRLAGLLERRDAPQVLVSYSERVSRKGTPIFVSGADVTERRGWSDEDIKEHVRWQRRVLANLRKAPVFHVAVVNGVALGWGTEYLLTCDYRLACDQAAFGLPETGLGIVPGAGGTSELWSHVGIPFALRLGMTGERIGADEALRIGLVQERCATVSEGLERAQELAALVASRSPTAVATFKRAVLASIGRDPAVREEEEARAYEHCVDAGEAVVGRSHFDAIRKGERAPWGPRTPWIPLN